MKKLFVYSLGKPLSFIIVVILILYLEIFGVSEKCSASQLEPYVNILDYGVIQNDPSVDNIKAIQKAINDTTDITNSKYKRSIYFPEGVYYISPSSTNYLRIKSNLHITGDKNAVIKVRNDAGDYRMIFGPANSSDCIENVSISNITIDQNGPNNTTSKVSTDYDCCQFILWIGSGNNFMIDNVNCNSYCGINAFSFDGLTTSNVTVKNCYFKFLRSAGIYDYDSSALRIVGKNQLITNNHFYTDILQDGHTAIETHCGASIVSGNIIDGFRTSIRIVSQKLGETLWEGGNNITVAENVITNANSGIGLLSYTDQKLSNITISQNTISIFNVAHNENYSFGIAMLNEEELLEGSYENINISNNTIKFQKELDERSNLMDAQCYGIGISSQGKIENVNVHNNLISNAPLTGIKLGFKEGNNTYSNIYVNNNLILNSGNYKYAKKQNYRAAIYLTGNLDDVFVEKNSIYDDNEIFSGFQSIVTCGNEFKCLSVKDNAISSTQGGYYFHIPSTTLNVDVGKKVNFYNVDKMPMEDKTTLHTGDIIFEECENDVAESCSYRVLESGTTGALTGVVANTGKGNNIILVNDSSNIDVGDYIGIDGSVGYYKILKITGNELLLCRRCDTSLIGAQVSFKTPIYESFY